MRWTNCTLLFLTLALGLAPPTLAEITDIEPHRAAAIDAAVPEQPTVDPAQPRRVLIFQTPAHLMESDPHAGYCIPYGAYALQALGERTGAYEPVVSDDLAMFLPENIDQFDAIMLNNTSQQWITPTEADMQREEFQAHGDSAEAVEQVLRQTLLNYVASGKGLAGLHFAIGANRHWPEFEQLLGARYAGHPWHEEVGIRVDEPNHPLVATFEGEDFRLTEEIYQFADPYSRDNVRVLLSLDVETTNMDVDWINRDDSDFALAWVRPYGTGRVFYTAFGHRAEIYQDPQMLRFYLDGLQFAIGDLEAAAVPLGVSPQDDDDFVSIFNGEDLSGWVGDEDYWSVEDGAIRGTTVNRPQLQHNNFLIWEDGQPENFELRLQYRFTELGGNSGIYFRSQQRPEGEPLVGPQADMSYGDGWSGHRWTGVLMEWMGRDMVAGRGERVRVDVEGERQVIGSVGDPEALLHAVHDADWNDYTLIANGGHLVLKINGVVMSEVIDEDADRPRAGHLALQVHTGPPMTVYFRDIRIRELDAFE